VGELQEETQGVWREDAAKNGRIVQGLLALSSVLCGQAAEWGLQMMIVGAQRIREAERKAKQTKAGVWHDYVQPASAGTKLSDHFSGTVVEVVSGDIICVKDAASGTFGQVL